MLETDRLILRAWKESDASECYKYAKDPKVGPIAGWAPHASIENSKQIIKDYLMIPETYAIVLKETNSVIGSVALLTNSTLAKGGNEVELGYWVGVPHWNNGYATEAAKELLKHAFDDLKVESVVAGYYEGNNQSKRVLEKLGFRFIDEKKLVDVPQLKEKRLGYLGYISKEDWIK